MLTPTISLTTPVSSLFGVGEAYAKKLEKLNILTVRDLLYHKPTRYEDWSLISPIANIQAGERVTVVGKLTSIQPLTTKTGKQLQLGSLTDDTGTLPLVWFNQRYLATALKPGSFYSLAGQADNFSNRLHLISPEFELLKINYNPLRNEVRSLPVGKRETKNVETIHTGRLVPIYPETYGVSSKWLRARIAYLLQELLPIPDWLPDNLRLQRKVKLSVESLTLDNKVNPKPYPLNPIPLLNLSEALYQLHFPDSLPQAELATHRLAHDELLLLHLETLQRRHLWNLQKANLSHESLALNDETKNEERKTNLNSFISTLPFTLTSAQQRSINEILEDLHKEKPMNRLLEGDVGSGKTVVAAAAAYTVAQTGHQTALMAPTEILAQQHYQTISKLLAPFNQQVALQTSRTKHFTKNEKRETKNDQRPDILIGTHALLTDIVNLDRLALVIIDEQHRFGVEQRAKLIHKGKSPHVLNMTATPIPRTISLTLYGDLDLSLLNELPPGRLPIKTWLVPNPKRPSAYAWIQKQLDRDGLHPSPHQDAFLTSEVLTKGDNASLQPNTETKNDQRKTTSQAFIVCPFIEPSETLSTVKAASEEFHKLQKIFSGFKLELLHGRLKGPEKDQIIENFRAGHTDILVSTPVVEVGVDIPNASIMVIEDADRFGLAQLHQLRGRVGRGGQQAYCLLFTGSNSEKTHNRLKALETSTSGLELAEIDLKLRGPGQMFGTSQHGFTDLRFASYTDHTLIHQTKHLAQTLFPDMDKYPELKNQLETRTIRHIEPN